MAYRGLLHDYEPSCGPSFQALEMTDIMGVITKVQLRHQPGAADRGLARGAGHLQAEAGPRGGAEAEQVV